MTGGEKSCSPASSYLVMGKQFYIYIMTNKSNRVLYTGVTGDLIRRVYEHKAGIKEGFTQRYFVNKLVYYEVCAEAKTAIAREKQIKAGPRRRKVALIERMNPRWDDLWNRLVG